MRSFPYKSLRILAISMLLLPVLGTSKGQQSAVERTVSLSVSVTESHGRFVTGLQKDQFRLVEKNTLREISSISQSDDPASVAILVDTSGSMSRETMDASVKFIVSMRKMANRSSEFLLVGFDAESRVLCDWNCSDAALDQALTSLTRATPRRSTALFDTLQSTIGNIETRKNGRRAIVILSDGVDNKSKVSSNRVRDQLKKTDIIVYAVNPKYNRDETANEGKGLLTMLASVTGGKAYFPAAVYESTDIAKKISIELKLRYTLTFKMPGTADHQFHSVKVSVPPQSFPTPPKPPALTIVSRPEFLDK